MDAGQLTSETVVARARELLRREGRLVDPEDEAPTPAYPDLDHRAAALAGARRAVQPPDLGTSRSGAAARAAVFAKRAVRKATYWYVEPRLDAQARFDDEVVTLAQDLGALQRSVQGAVSNQSSSLQWLTERIDQATEALRERSEALEREVAALRRELALRPDREELAQIESRLEGIARGAAVPDIDYVAFENRFRGPSEEVRRAQRDYVHLFATTDDVGPVVDIGCGRGEMLSLLREAGVTAVGIDIDESMLALCSGQGLSVERASAVAWLRERADASLRGIYLAQVVEHLPTPDLVALVQQAARTIAPGGVFVAETIDPRSLFATANYFWADLSHIRPVHPATLAFLLEQAGFVSTEVLQRSPHPMLGLAEDVPDDATRTAIAELARTVFGTQDYAVVAHR